MSSTFFLIISAAFQTVATALIKLSSNYKTCNKKRFFITFGGAMLLYGGGFALYALGLSGLNLSIAQPVFSSTMFLGTALISIFFFKDKLSLQQIAGLVVITAGIVTVIN